MFFAKSDCPAISGGLGPSSDSRNAFAWLLVEVHTFRCMQKRPAINYACSASHVALPRVCSINNELSGLDTSPNLSLSFEKLIPSGRGPAHGLPVMISTANSQDKYAARNLAL